jgi:regulator of replication initiation timing
MSAQLSHMLRTDKEVLLSLVHTEANTRSSADLLWQELRKLHCCNQRLARENEHLRRRLQEKAGV